MTAGQETQTASVDGRTARALRTREAIVDACISLVDEGVLKPTAPRIAERAGVSVRSVFQHFDDLESLFAMVAERVVGRLASILVADRPGLPARRADRALRVGAAGAARGDDARSAGRPPCTRRSPRRSGRGSRPATTSSAPSSMRVFAPELAAVPAEPSGSSCSTCSTSPRRGRPGRRCGRSTAAAPRRARRWSPACSAPPSSGSRRRHPLGDPPHRRSRAPRLVAVLAAIWLGGLRRGRAIRTRPARPRRPRRRSRRADVEHHDVVDHRRRRRGEATLLTDDDAVLVAPNGGRARRGRRRRPVRGAGRGRHVRPRPATSCGWCVPAADGAVAGDGVPWSTGARRRPRSWSTRVAGGVRLRPGRGGRPRRRARRRAGRRSAQRRDRRSAPDRRSSAARARSSPT